MLEEEEEEIGMVMEDMVGIHHSMVKRVTQVEEVDLEMLLMVDMVAQEVGEVEVVEVEGLVVEVEEDHGVMDILVVTLMKLGLVEVEEEEVLQDLVVMLLGVEMENIIVK